MKKMRRILACLMAFLLISHTPVYATMTGPLAPNAQTGQSSTSQDLKTPEIQAEGAVVIDAATGQVLYGKNEKTRFYPASTTKLMTALLVLEQIGRASCRERVWYLV